MNNFKSPEDMTMDEIEQQLALYQRLYYAKRKEDEQFMQKKREASLRHVQKTKIKEFIEENKLSEEDLTPTQITEIITDKKPSGKKRGAPKYDMIEYKVVMPNSLENDDLITYIKSLYIAYSYEREAENNS